MAIGDILTRLDDKWLSFTGPVEVVSATAVEEVLPAVCRIEALVRDGLTAAGFVAYEAAPAFDAALPGRDTEGLPLLWFGLYDQTDVVAPPGPAGDYTLGPWQASVAKAAYDRDITRIKSYIEAGDTYQVNFTFRLRADFAGDPKSLFADMCRVQNAPYGAYVDCGSHVICSATPELFFQERGGRIVSRPMKGTSSRGRTVAEDRELAEALRHSAKNRSENVMIVDMIRNDLGRVAHAGSVRVTSAYDIERYPTVFQMTSTVEAKSNASVEDILRALFPCASVTGAPKVRTMEIIRELESAPRGVYCGAIGVVTPDAGTQFGVAIRTVAIDRATGRAEYGTGGGVVWDSDPSSEYEECLTKARIVCEPYPDFKLLETLLWTPEDGFVLLDRHLARLEESRIHFDYAPPRTDLSKALNEAVHEGGGASCRVRLLLDRQGEARVETHAVSQTPGRPWRVAVSSQAVSSRNRFLFHKTTFRDVYEQARAGRPDCDDVILVNECGDVTEATVANVIVRIGTTWFTPPLSCGLLAGTRRADMLAKGTLSERILKPADLATADEFMLINSVRGRIPCVLVP